MYEPEWAGVCLWLHRKKGKRFPNQSLPLKGREKASLLAWNFGSPLKLKLSLRGYFISCGHSVCLCFQDASCPGGAVQTVPHSRFTTSPFIYSSPPLSLALVIGSYKVAQVSLSHETLPGLWLIATLPASTTPQGFGWATTTPGFPFLSPII